MDELISSKRTRSEDAPAFLNWTQCDPTDIPRLQRMALQSVKRATSASTVDEAIAQLVDALRARTGQTEPPYDPIRAAKVLGIDVAEEEDGISSALLYWGGSGQIIVNATRPEKTRRFAVAHEVGHVLFARAADLMVRDDRLRIQLARYGSSAQLESCCNAVAERFLAPTAEVRSLLGSNPALRFAAIEQIAKRFGCGTGVAAMAALRAGAKGIVVVVESHRRRPPSIRWAGLDRGTKRLELMGVRPGSRRTGIDVIYAAAERQYGATGGVQIYLDDHLVGVFAAEARPLSGGCAMLVVNWHRSERPNTPDALLPALRFRSNLEARSGRAMIR